MFDIAVRTYNHSYKLDPIVRSLFDVDFYKLLMMQFVWKFFKSVVIKWAVTNRTTSVKLAEEINIDELRAQLDYVRTLRVTPQEQIWLRGQTFYGETGIFSSEFVADLATLQLPEFNLSEKDGQIVLTAEGIWWQTILWETIFLSILNEMRSRAKLHSMSKSTLDIVYARAKVRLYDDLEKLKVAEVPNITDFGTRRRHSFLWQEHCVLTAAEVLGDAFTGTSNVYLAMKHGLEAKGTNAHELPMVYAALADGYDQIKASQYKVLEDWGSMYGGNLRMFLPDTFGTTQFLRDAPDWVAEWTGARPDSKPPLEAAHELLDYWKLHNQDPKEKLILFSDGLNVDTMITMKNIFNGVIGKIVNIGFGWGTNLTNNFHNTVPNDANFLNPISIVCKVVEANGRPCVKLSDNIAKATGNRSEVQRYIDIFGNENMSEKETVV